MTSPAALCLITPGHLASTPRLVKHADTLVAAGFRVHVVAGRHFRPCDPLDAAIIATARWTCSRVAYSRGFLGAVRRLLRQFARQQMLHSFITASLAARAQHAGWAALTAAAAKVPADLYFGHGGVAGLAIAATAAQRRGAAYGFDAEDWHEEESDFVRNDPAEHAAVHTLLRAWLPAARPLTCAAPLIGAAFARAYGVQPTTMLNVFPLREAPATPQPPPAPTADAPAIFYWFSQTIGPGRGLEDMLAVIGQMRTPAVLHLRGFVDETYRRRLDATARTAGARPPVFLPPAPAAEMARLAVGAHLGLSLEQSQPPNRDLCLTNKIFTYLLAGVPVALTPTNAQRALAPQLGEAAVLVNLTAAAATARQLDAWLVRRAGPAAATAWQLGQSHFNWDQERSHLVAAVDGALT